MGDSNACQPPTSFRTMSKPPPKNGNLRVSVSDFGPIGKGEVEIRPLTIFAGPSNTGKSYLSTLVYALHKCFHDTPGDRPKQGLQWLDEFDPLTDEESKQLSDWVDGCMRKQPNSPDQAPSYPDAIRKRIEASTSELRGYGNPMRESLARCFAVRQLGELVRGTQNHNRKARIRVTAPEGRFDVAVSSKSKIALQAQVSPALIRKPGVRLEEVLSFRSLRPVSKKQGRDLQHSMFVTLATLPVTSCFEGLLRNMHYIPADRPGILNVHRVIVSTLVAQAAYGKAGNGLPTPDLSGVDTDFLQTLIGLDGVQGAYASHARGMEKEVLDGKILMERTKDAVLPFFSYLPQRKGGSMQIPLGRTSSMVSELAPLVLHLRHVAQAGDLLIIEEPEAHLHPEKQTRLAVQLARLVAKGLRVLVTTHSEWVLNQFANLVGFSELSGPAKAKIEKSYPQLHGGALDAKDVGLWSFSHGKGRAGSTVTEVGFDEEAKDYATGFSDIGDEILNEWAGIANLIGKEAEK